MKTLWLSSLVSSEDQVKNLMTQLNHYGLEVKGHFWEDDLEKFAWIKPRDELLKPKIDLWAILASEKDLCVPSFRYGLSLLAITVQAQKGLSFPILVLLTEGELSSQDFPTPLKGTDVLSVSDAGFGAKLVAKAHSPHKEVTSEYRLDIYGSSQIGQWFEVGPQNSPWMGAMFGVTGAKITFQAVGPKGSLPNQSVLNYPLKGLKLNLGEKEYTAWAVQNALDLQSSYFVKVVGFPETVVFGSYSGEKEAEAFVVKLK